MHAAWLGCDQACYLKFNSFNSGLSHCFVAKTHHTIARVHALKPNGNPTTLAPVPLKSHLPSLDGIRAVSILLVVLAHSSDACGRFSYLNNFGGLGVSIFFVISGLLITWLMIRERDATGRFSLRDFYIRRFIRIVPVFWLLILTVIILKAAGAATISWPDILRSFTFTHDYPLSLAHPAESSFAWWLGHTWSLSVEEQFYLIWPSLFALLPKRVSPRLALVFVFSGPFLRIMNYYLFPHLRGYEGYMFHTRMDTLMAGCTSAFLLASPIWRERIKRIPVLPVVFGTSFLLFVVDPALTAHFHFHSSARTIVGLILPTVEAFAIAAALLVLIVGKHGLVFRALNSGAVRHVGKLSYSLYLWQQLFLSPGIAPTMFSLLLRVIGAYLTALCTFNFLERPFVRLRGRFRHGISV